MVSSSACSFIDLLRMGFIGPVPSERLLPTVADARYDRCRAGRVLDVIGGDVENAQTTSARKAHAIATRPQIKEKVFITIVMMTVLLSDDAKQGLPIYCMGKAMLWQHWILPLLPSVVRL